MLAPNSGPHVIENLRGRVASLTEALERAQGRIDELEKAFGQDDDIFPLIALGLTRSQARLVHLMRSRDYVTGEQMQLALYADNPDLMHERDSRSVMKTQICHARRVLERLCVTFEAIGYGKGSSGYRMAGPDKMRLAHLVASGARLVTRGRPDRKYYRKTAPLPQCEPSL